jgi:hypothetical protein
VPIARTRVGPQGGRSEEVRDIKTDTAARRIRVAVIEDDERARRALSFQLRTAGFGVTAYTSAEEILSAPMRKNSIVSWRTSICRR